MAKPARPELVFRNLDEMLADVDRLKAGPYEKTGQWELPQILDHLTKGVNACLAHEKAVPWPLDIAVRVAVHLINKRTYYPPFKFHAPKDMQPATDISLDQADTAFRAAIEQIKSLPGPVVPHTAFGKMPLADLIKLQLLHGAHHLSFLRPM